MLTVKSDDVVGRVRTYEAIVKGENIPEPGVPESFKVLVKELQSLALDVKVLSEEEGELPMQEEVEDQGPVLDVNIESTEPEEDEPEEDQEEPGEEEGEEDLLEDTPLFTKEELGDETISASDPFSEMEMGEESLADFEEVVEKDNDSDYSDDEEEYWFFKNSKNRRSLKENLPD